MLDRIIRIAAFQNPEFYKTQAMRLSTWNFFIGSNSLKGRKPISDRITTMFLR